MAQLQVNFFSKTLMRQVAITAIVPVDKFIFAPDAGEPKEKAPLKTLYLLHGIFGNCTDWMSCTRIQEWATDRNLAVIMPSGDNSFYVDNPTKGDFYGEFIGRELVEFTRDLLPLSTKREDTFIAGLSMGGFGAIRNGLKYHETFAYVAGLSSGFVLEMALNATNDDPLFFRRRDFYETIFGNLDTLLESDMNPKKLVKDLVESKASIPELYVCCGTEDFLLEANQDFHQYLLDYDVEHTYIEGPGAHDWNYWGEYIVKVMDWLPLDGAEKGISSGNVTN